MPEIKLGTKYDCFSCGTKFYDLGKSEPVCPKCGANQKDASQSDSAAASQSSRRKRKAEVAKAVDLEDEEPIADIADDEIVSPVGVLDDEELVDEEEDEDDDFDEA
ncbi:MAG TPA: FYDLN acid domain-containing protein [Thermoanaerobaculia bacterium]|jgi:hypothetical protein|nr:FYDLN acid domain-containing protein [Thermoanaerobaculia bacterium]